MLNYKKYGKKRTDENKAATAALINRAKRRTGWTEARPTATATRYSLDRIRRTYGSTTIKGDEQTQKALA